MKKKIILILVLLLAAGIFPAKSKADYEKDIKLFYEALVNVKDNYITDIEFKELIYSAIEGLMSGLDPHSAFLEPKGYQDLQRNSAGEYGGVGMVVSVKNNILTCVAPMEDTPSYKLGIKSGDQILKIDGMETANMNLEMAVDMLRGEPGTTVKVTMYREATQELKEYNIKREIIKVKSVKYVVYDKIGYLRLTDFKQNSHKEIADAIKEMEKSDPMGYIIDLRNNPGGLLQSAIDVSNLFLPKGTKIVSVKGRYSQENITYYAMAKPVMETKPIVLMINEGSASASEIVAGALRDNKRAIIIGEKSFGKGSVQRIFPLSDGSAIKITIAKYYTPVDECIHGVGISPDLLVRQTYYTDTELTSMEKIESGKFIDDYLGDMELRIKSREKMDTSFEKTNEGYDKLDLETYSLNPVNIIMLENKLKGNNLSVSKELLRLLVIKGLEKRKLSTDIIDPVMDAQLKNAFNSLKTIIWQSKGS